MAKQAPQPYSSPIFANFAKQTAETAQCTRNMHSEISEIEEFCESKRGAFTPLPAFVLTKD